MGEVALRSVRLWRTQYSHHRMYLSRWVTLEWGVKVQSTANVMDWDYMKREIHAHTQWRSRHSNRKKEKPLLISLKHSKSYKYTPTHYSSLRPSSGHQDCSNALVIIFFVTFLLQCAPLHQRAPCSLFSTTAKSQAFLLLLAFSLYLGIS